MKSCIFNCDQVSNKSKEIAEIVGNEHKGDHNNYFAAESLHMGDENAWLRGAKLIDVRDRRTRQTRRTRMF